jgi:hypothetical protein
MPRVAKSEGTARRPDWGQEAPRLVPQARAARISGLIGSGLPDWRSFWTAAHHRRGQIATTRNGDRQTHLWADCTTEYDLRVIAARPVLRCTEVAQPTDVAGQKLPVRTPSGSHEVRNSLEADYGVAR